MPLPFAPLSLAPPPPTLSLLPSSPALIPTGPRPRGVYEHHRLIAGHHAYYAVSRLGTPIGVGLHISFRSDTDAIAIADTRAEMNALDPDPPPGT